MASEELFRFGLAQSASWRCKRATTAARRYALVLMNKHRALFAILMYLAPEWPWDCRYWAAPGGLVI